MNLPDNVALVLSDEERQLGRIIKTVIEEAEHLKRRSDFDCAHLAVACGSAEKALDVAYKLQCFREQYKIDDTVEDGVRTIRGLMEQQPGLLLDICYLPDELASCVFFDYAEFTPSRVRTEEDWRHIQGGCYYVYMALFPNFHTIRNGVVSMVECEGMSTANVDMRVEERMAFELYGYYPMKAKDTYCLHSPMAFVVLLNLLKRILPSDITERVHLNVKYGGYEGRMDALFKLPTLEAAKERLLVRIGTFLAERYRNEAQFQL